MMTKPAERIVDLQESLNKGDVDAYSAQTEQRLLWSSHFPDMSFEQIAHDAWLTRRIDKYPSVSAPSG
jgi:hypothetical protein